MARHEKKRCEAKQLTSQASQREWGIDLLRILSMYLVVVLHILGAGGVLDAAPFGSTRYWIAWLMEAGAFCAVNCFALISGFVMCDKPVKPHRLVSLWVQVLLYSVSTTLLTHHFYPERVGGDLLRRAFLPVLGKQYWYFTAYVMLFLFLPVLNKGIRALTRRQHFGMLAAAITAAGLTRIFNCMPAGGQSFLLGDPYFEDGYSFLWLAVMYLLGAYIRRYVNKESVNRWGALAGYFAFSLLTFGVRFCIMQRPGGPIGAGQLYSYLSPTVVGAAVMLFLFCWTLHFTGWAQKLVAAVSPLAFGVYLIHTSPAVFSFVVAGSFTGLAALPALRMTACVLGISLAVFIGCIAVDAVRAALFRLLRVDGLCKKLTEAAAPVLDWMM